MTKNEITYRQDELKKQADHLLIEYRKLTGTEQQELENILLELEGINLKVTSPDPKVTNPVTRIRKKRKVKNQQLILTF